MNVTTLELTLRTEGFTDIIDLTPRLIRLLEENGFSEGQMLVFVPGSTAAVTTIEYEPGLKKDLKELLEEWIPMDRRYFHDDTWHDGNGYAHLRASLFKPSLHIPFKQGRLLLGTWQQVILVDFDNRPRLRNVIVQLMGTTSR